MKKLWWSRKEGTEQRQPEGTIRKQKGKGTKEQKQETKEEGQIKHEIAGIQNWT